MSLWDAYVFGRLSQAGGGSGDWDPDTQRFVTYLALATAAVGAVVWAVWKVYITLVNFTEANTQGVFLGLGAVGMLVAGGTRWWTNAHPLSSSECTRAITFGVGGIVLVVGLKGGALALSAVSGSDPGMWALLPGAILFVVFLVAIAGMLFNTTYVTAFGRSAVPGVAVGALATWASLAYLWFLVFGELGQFPFGNPLPGLNAMDAVFVAPSVLLAASGAGWLALGGAGVIGLPSEVDERDQHDGGALFTLLETWGTYYVSSTSHESSGSGKDTEPESPSADPVDSHREEYDPTDAEPSELAGMLVAEDVDVRRDASERLRVLAETDPATVGEWNDALVDALDDPDSVVVHDVLWALRYVGREQPAVVAPAAPTVARLLDHDRPSVRSAAVTAAAEVVEENPEPFAAAVETVASHLDATDLRARRAASRILRVLADEQPDALRTVTGPIRGTLEADISDPKLERNLRDALRQVTDIPT